MASQHSAGLSETSPNRPPRTLREINNLNKEFWWRQSELKRIRIASPKILEAAINKTNWESLIDKPLRWRKSFDQALEEAARNERIRSQQKELRKRARTAKADALRNFSKMGGKAPKTDTLSLLIHEIVSADRSIDQQRLLQRLKREEGKGIIDSIDRESELRAGDVREIHFRAHDGRIKTAPISGLKDRLTRIRAKINSR